METKINKTVAEAIEEIKNKIYTGEALTADTMLIALGALIVFENK